ncbi:MAG: YCF48-related protein [Alcanivoracaceae bacterium]|nr:YCF48-related protein [Alcanivoracaceae bacterium]
MKKIALSLGALVLASGSLMAGELLPTNSPVLTANLYLDAARAGTRVVAVGDRGQVVYSDNEGQHWQRAQTPSGVLLTALCFADSRNGWAVGHDAVVLGTNDGGATWQQQYSDVLGADTGEDDADDYADEDYSDEDYSDDYYSEDYSDFGEADAGGQDTSGAPLLDVVCLNKNRALAVGGYGYLVETTNGGASWQKVVERIENGNGWHLNSIAQVPGGNTLLVAGEKGLLLRSRDNGLSWKELESPYDGSFFGVSALVDGTVLAYGLQGNLWVSRNQGDSWRQVRTGVTRGINAATQLDDGSVVLAGGAGVVLVSRDGGNSVVLQYLPDRESVSSLLPLTGGELLMVGDAGIRVKSDIR